MKPHDGTLDVEEATVQAIALTQVDCGHASAASAVVALVVGGNDLAPGVSRLLGAVLAEADVDEEVAVFLVWLEIGGRVFAGPFVDWSCARGDAIPAAEFSCPFGFIVERCAERNNALDLGSGVVRIIIRARWKKKTVCVVARIATRGNL